MIQTRSKKILLLTMACIFVFALTGCAHGIGETIDIVSRSEKAKQNIEHMVNGGGEKVQSVGTIATPPVQKGYITLRDASVSYDNGEFSLSWDALTDSDRINVQLFAYLNDNKAESFRLASIPNAVPIGELKFAFLEEIQPGTYKTFAKVVDENDNTDSMDMDDTFTIADPANTEDTGLKNVTYRFVEDSIVITWEDDGSSSYCARIIDNNTDAILGETIVTENRARLSVPEGYSEFSILVGSYENSTIRAAKTIPVRVP